MSPFRPFAKASGTESQEAAKLRNAVRAKWPNRLVDLDIALHTGMRRGEMYRLTSHDVDLARRCRHVRLNAIALAALMELHDGAEARDPVFHGRSGAALKGPRHWFEDAVDEAGLANVHWHDLRHTFASRLAMAGVGIRAIEDALGHKSLAMTVRYSHLSPDFLQEAVDKLVPPQRETGTPDATDTRTDTGDLGSAQSPTDSVH